MTTIEETTRKHGLCIGCGLCTAACPEDAISMHWHKKLAWSPRIDRVKCTDCGLCSKVCPNTPECISEYATAAAKAGERFGLQNRAKYFIAYDLNPQNRIRSASGGALTATLMQLLQSGKVDGVIASVPVMAPMGKPHYELKIISSTGGLDKARSSHYHPLSYDKVLKEIVQRKGRYAITGVPCIIRGIEKLPKKIRNRIRYTFSLVCSHNVTGRFLDCLARQEGVLEGEHFTADIRDKWGNIPDANNFNNYFKLSDREIRRNRFQTAFTDMWRNYFFAQECCLYCPDFYGVDADMSVKDGWGRLSKDPLGISLLIVRNPELVAMLHKISNEGKLFLKPCDVDEVFQSQFSTPRFKHVAVRDRLVWKSTIRRELLKNNYPLGTARQWWKHDTFEYWRLRMTMSLADCFYTHWRRVPVRKIIKGARIVTYFAPFMWEKLLIIWRKLLRFKKILKGFISPVAYIIKAFFKHPIICPTRPNKTDNLQVLIAGGYGYKNTGDEAQLASVISHWKRLCSNVKLTILSPNPEYTQETHKEDSELASRVILFAADKKGDYGTSNFWFRWRFRWTKPRILFLARLYHKGLPLPGAYPAEAHLLELIANADVLHFSGGGYLTGITLSRLWDGMLLIRIADILNTPVILSGQTIGVFKDKTSKRLARWGLSKAKLIYLRDPEGSIADIHSLGIKGTHIKATFDDALFCNMADKKSIDECLRKNGINNGASYAAVNVHYFKQKPSDIRRIMKRIAEICDHLVLKHGVQLLFIPFHPRDARAMEEVQKNMSKESKILDYNFDYRMTKGIIGRANILITMKHHGIIFAMDTETPTIAIAIDDYYIRKNAGALKLFNQEKWLVDKKRLFSPGILEKMIDDCFNKIEDHKAIISSHLREMRKQDGEAIWRFLEEHWRRK